MKFAHSFLAVTAASALAFALSGCASSSDGAGDPGDPADDSEVEATSQDLVASPGQGCRWVLRFGQACPRFIVGGNTNACLPAPRFPGYHWQKVCRET